MVGAGDRAGDVSGDGAEEAIAQEEQQALSVAPRSWLAHFAKAQGRFEEAIPEYETVIELNRSAAYAFSTLGQCKLLAGSLEEAIPLQMAASACAIL